MAIIEGTYPQLVRCCSKFKASSTFRINAQLCPDLPAMPARSPKAGLPVLVEVILQGIEWQVVNYIRSQQPCPVPITLSSCKQTGQHDSMQQQCGANKAKLGPFHAKLVRRSQYSWGQKFEQPKGVGQLRFFVVVVCKLQEAPLIRGYAELCSDRADIRSMTVSHHPNDNAQQQ